MEIQERGQKCCSDLLQCLILFFIPRYADFSKYLNVVKYLTCRSQSTSRSFVAR